MNRMVILSVQLELGSVHCRYSSIPETTLEEITVVFFLNVDVCACFITLNQGRLVSKNKHNLLL